MLHKRFVLRELTASPRQYAVFVLCVMLSLVTLTALNGFSQSIRKSLLRDARTLQGADIILRSHFPFSPALTEKVSELEKQGKVRSARIYEFYSVVRSVDESRSLLADVKIAEPGYPFYGKAELASGRELGDVLRGGNAVAEQNLLDRLGLRVGDSLRAGSAILTIADVIVKEPDRPVSFLSFGPRLLVAAADIDALDLLKKGSRVRYVILLRIPEGENPDELAADLRRSALADQERVETFKESGSRIRRFFDNFFFFLALIAIFTFLLAGIGIRSTVKAIFREKEKSIAIIRAMGGTGRFVLVNYMVLISILGITGTLLGLAAGFALQHMILHLFSNLLPSDMHIVFSWQTAGEGTVLGILGVAVFAFLPLHRVRNIRPAAVFRLENPAREKGTAFYLSIFLGLAFFIALVMRQIADWKTGAYVLAGLGGLIVFTALAVRVILSGLRRIHFRSLMLRQSAKGLFRPGNATASVIVTLSASLAVIFSIYLLEENLDAAFVRSYPADAPNLFFIDIQPDQAEAVSELLGMKPVFYPVIRARLLSVNGEKIDRNQETRRRGDNMTRAFNLTYRDELLEDEILLSGESLFQQDSPELQVSVLDTVVEMKPMKIGDILVFNIQGVPVEARISSIRGRKGESVKPFFYFVFPQNSLLKDAPQTIFTAIRVLPERMAETQTRVVSRFPNVSVIDVTQTLASFANIAHRLSLLIRFFTFFSIAAGILIIVSSVLATRFARMQEAVYYKILGAGNRFVLGVFTMENILIGGISAFLALLISHTGTWILCGKYFDISYRPYIVQSLLMTTATLMLVVTVGYLASFSILRQRPAAFLREQTGE
ncbi:MAG: FtsX-like permease family protein [Desulfobacterales bacterium]